MVIVFFFFICTSIINIFSSNFLFPAFAMIDVHIKILLINQL